MKNTINGMKLSNGNYVIELDEFQIDDLLSMYLSKYVKYRAEAGEQKDIDDCKIYESIASECLQIFKSIRAIKG